MIDGLVDALRRHGVTDVDDSALAQSLYSSDASLYRIPPRVVVRPRSTDEVAAALQVGRELGVPLTMRGAGTSTSRSSQSSGVPQAVAIHCSAMSEPQPSELLGIALPFLRDPDAQRQEDAGADERLDARPRPCTDVLQS